jgi:hypothetical protein
MNLFLQKRTPLLALSVVALVTTLWFLPLEGQTTKSADKKPRRTQKVTEHNDEWRAQNRVVNDLEDRLHQLIQERNELIELRSQAREKSARVSPEIKDLAKRLQSMEDLTPEAQEIAEQLQSLINQQMERGSLSIIARVKDGIEEPEEGAENVEVDVNAVEDVGVNVSSQMFRMMSGGSNDIHAMFIVGAVNDQSYAEKTHALMATYDKYTDANRHEFMKKLTDVVTQHFDVKQNARETRLNQLETQLQKLRAVHQQRTKEKDKIIADRVNQLAREAAGLGWGDESHAVPGIPSVDFHTTIESLDSEARPR